MVSVKYYEVGAVKLYGYSMSLQEIGNDTVFDEYLGESVNYLQQALPSSG